MSLTEKEAEEKIRAIIPSEIKAPIVEVIKREPLSRLEHQAIFAIIFKHTKENSLLMVEAVKKLSINEPKFIFSGSEVDEKFDMENSAVFITATIK
ncbi:hypothetical protein AAX29_00562 [Aliarcobacter thereius]|uniref:Uncharacterized protein n=1 Tax=Aliarcobacter thereius TaxID=544718 RepID=A0A1C0B7I2_9BACT|nr:hypothetical protein [Aliarcobacter thereius]OCL99521.1 hypothetical protein AAX29_00562 [Aliarcobacter thereius]